MLPEVLTEKLEYTDDKEFDTVRKGVARRLVKYFKNRYGEHVGSVPYAKGETHITVNKFIYVVKIVETDDPLSYDIYVTNGFTYVKFRYLLHRKRLESGYTIKLDKLVEDTENRFKQFAAKFEDYNFIFINVDVYYSTVYSMYKNIVRYISFDNKSFGLNRFIRKYLYLMIDLFNKINETKQIDNNIISEYAKRNYEFISEFMGSFVTNYRRVFNNRVLRLLDTINIDRTIIVFPSFNWHKDKTIPIYRILSNKQKQLTISDYRKITRDYLINYLRRATIATLIKSILYSTDYQIPIIRINTINYKIQYERIRSALFRSRKFDILNEQQQDSLIYTLNMVRNLLLNLNRSDIVSDLFIRIYDIRETTTISKG